MTAEVLLFEQLRVARDILGPQLVHHPPYVIGPEILAIGVLVAELAQALNPGKRIAWISRERCVRRLMHDALRSDVELVAPD